MNEKTYISIEFWQLIGFLIMIFGGYWTFAKMMLTQYQNQQQDRHTRQDKINENTEKFNKDYLEFQARLPLTYVLREDYIRGQAVLEAKMDAVHGTLSELYKLESVRK